MSMIANYQLLTDRELQEMKKLSQVYFGLIKYKDSENNYLCLEEYWHAIQFLMTEDVDGGEPPLVGVILGGIEFGEDFGYGKPRYYTKKDIIGINKAFQKLNGTWVQKQFDKWYPSFNTLQIYPFNWSDEKRDYQNIEAKFKQLQNFFQKCENTKLNLIAFFD
jgi:Domain of unknown function (DUF1877)